MPTESFRRGPSHQSRNGNNYPCDDWQVPLWTTEISSEDRAILAIAGFVCFISLLGGVLAHGNPPNVWPVSSVVRRMRRRCPYPATTTAATMSTSCKTAILCRVGRRDAARMKSASAMPTTAKTQTTRNVQADGSYVSMRPCRIASSENEMRFATAPKAAIPTTPTLMISGSQLAHPKMPHRRGG